MNKSLFVSLLILFTSTMAFAQKWVDTTYQVLLTKDIPYGSSIDFAGTTRTHLLNVCVPVNDTIPSCGRPLLLCIHGGAFMAGSKDGDQIPLWVSDFAKRGYVTASINYRLGMFQTDALINCNISLLGVPWNCLNMQDTAEWYRGAYRGMQDAKGALRYLINHANDYHIDPKNVFITGESAGAIIALETAFLDDTLEKYPQASALANVNAPNAIYENQCIQTPGFATNIASMQLSRADLGSTEGDLNPSSITYTIKGVGSFYGAMFGNLFTLHSYTQSPRLYMFHQPNDLVVAYDQDRVEAGAAYCATLFPFNCQYLINRPYLYGSKGIQKMIDNMAGSGIPVPVYQFDSTTNLADCAAQLANPSLAGHAVDNPALRSLHLAQFFAPAIDTSGACAPLSATSIIRSHQVQIFPNPSYDYFYIQGLNDKMVGIEIRHLNGQSVFHSDALDVSQKIVISTLSPGFYMIQIKCKQQLFQSKLIKY